MKRVLKVILGILGVLGVLVVITLLAWVMWQVMPDNPDQGEWTIPPFPLAIAVWMVGMVPTLLLAFVSVVVGSFIASLFERIRRKPSEEPSDTVAS